MAQETKAGGPITFAPVREGLRHGSIVSDTFVPGFAGARDRGYYGGFLIAESVAPGALPAIVTAVNSHALLVDALRIAEQFMSIASDWNIDEAEINGEMRATYDWLEVVRAALAAAGAKA